MSDEDENLQSWGWTDLSSYSSSFDSEQEQLVTSFLLTGVMSRCSLRLDESLLDRGSAPFSVGGVSQRSSRSLRSQHSQWHSVSCSESLLFKTPHQVADYSVASDASLISSLLDESSIQESTLIDNLWGLEQDADTRGNALVAEEDCPLISSDSRSSHHRDPRVGMVYLEESSHQGEMKADGEGSVIYCRDRSHRRRAGETKAQPSQRGAMSLKELHPIGSLCRSVTAAFRWICRQWRRMTASSHLTRIFLRLLILLLPLLLVFSLCWFGSAGFCSVPPGVNISTWTMVPGLSAIHSLLSAQSPMAEGPAEESREESLLSQPPAAETPPPQVVNQEIPEVEESSDSERLIQVEQSLVALWEQVEAAGQRVEQRHNEVLRLYTDLKQQSPSPQRGSGSTEPRVSDLMDLRVLQLHRQLSEERRHREQIRRQDLLLLKMQTTRLDQLELQLQNLAARTWEVQQMQETTTSLPATVRVRMDSRSHDALQAEVKQMEATLGDIRQDVEVLSRCQNGCQQLDTMQQMGSEHVASLIREEIQDVIYGNELTPGRDDGNLPEPLLQWMSRRFISHDDLQEALTSLELNVLQNVSRLLQQQQGDEKTQDAAWHDILKNGNAGNAVTKEEVQRMLSDALRLFSQDRIGLADYALESGGGSILSTRCSETYQTTAALLSLFGVPLWYFSQSPRAVIQPDVHPGNCWAFKGSTGFLVIRLSMSILPTAFTMQHIPKALAPSGMLQSAPRDFSVYGLRDENQEGGKLLGTYTYEENGEDLQTFIISEENDESFQIIEVQVLSNWGHREYTCMYRFRVHGTPRDVWT
ncbi:SUN domain-containing protein 1 isoform X5 [Nothobranchius furzeri]|uniref:Transcript variant X4 n=2 Tax=Nothobranchius furzeri TaxID=105023 RepID=A0A9D2XK54_NOTFU|nr:transcript variant X4 [Nothobranchius furzeri]